MESGIIFKIAAVGIIVAILNQILKHSGRDDQAFSYKPCRNTYCALLGYSLHRRAVFFYAEAV